MRSSIDPQDFFILKDDPRAAARFLISLAAQAPSSHNTQPWLFRVRGNAIEVWGNEARRLSGSDKHDRELYISLGCAIENLLVAAEYYGLSVTTHYFPDLAKPFYAARVLFESFAPSISVLPRDHIGEHLVSRHASREPFRSEGPSTEVLAKLQNLSAPGVAIHLVTEPRLLERTVCVVGDATEEAFHDKNFTNELSHWIKPSLRIYRDGMPGYNIGIPWPISFIAPLAIRYANVAKQQRKMIEDMLKATPVFGIIKTSNDELRDWVTAGQRLERLWLTAEQMGLKVGVLAAAIEIGDHYRALQDVFGTDERPQVFFRLGYADKVPEQSPRLPVERIILA